MSLLHSHHRFVVSLSLILAINSWHLHNNLAVHAAKATSLTITNDGNSNNNNNNNNKKNNNNKRAKNLADDLLSNDLTPAEKAKAIVDAINPKDIEKIANQINAATKQADTLRQRLQTHVEAQVNKMLLSDNSEAVATVGGGDNDNNNDVVIDAAGTHHKLELKIDLPADLAELVSKGSSLRFSRKENGELGELTISGSADGSAGGGSGSGAASNDDDNGSVSSSSQQQQQQKQQPYQQPPDLPGDSSSGPRHQSNHPSRIQHAAMPSQRQAPYGFDEDDIDDDDDDMLPSRDGFIGGDEGGIALESQSSSPAAAQQQQGGMDLSQFNKDVIFSGLKRLYRKKIRPLELSSKYGHFHSPPLSPSDFDSKPMVLLLGQYSVGKTSFIRYLLGRDFPGQRIGPEPTTDRFVAILKGDSGDKIVPGAALCSQGDRPFRGLSPFGNNFLSRFEGVEMDSPILNNITLVDTPGILSGQKQSIGRNYDYEQVMKWFAERADLIIIMFDAHKLDISDELKRVIELLKPHQDKMRVLLNKADSISTQQLMRVYGALMWSLGKVMMTPEVCRVYMGSFWGAPLKNKEQAALLTQEKIDLFNDIAQLPQNAVMRRINELVKRARSVKVHAYIIHYLRKQLPYTWGKREKQRRLIDRLEREFVMCARRYELPRGDFPELEPFRQALLEIKDLSEIHKLDKKMVKEMDKVFSVDIPNLLEAARNS